jgi:hypothetical protein
VRAEVSVAQSDCDYAAGCITGVRFPAGAWIFSTHHRVQTCSGAHPSSYRMGTGNYYIGGKAAEVKNAWDYNSTPQYVFMAGCLAKDMKTLPANLIILCLIRFYEDTYIQARRFWQNKDSIKMAEMRVCWEHWIRKETRGCCAPNSYQPFSYRWA